MHLHFLLLTILINQQISIDCKRILFIPSHNSASHTKSIYPAAEALSKSHEVHVLQLIRDSEQECKNDHLIDRVIRTIRDDSERPNDNSKVILSEFIWRMEMTDVIGLIFPWKAMTILCARILSHPSSRHEFVGILREHWDAIFLDNLFAPCGILVIKNHPDALIIDLSTTVIDLYSTSNRGVPIRLSVEANFRMPVYENEKFLYRFSTTFEMFKYDFIMLAVNNLLPHWDLRDVQLGLVFDRSTLAITCVPQGVDFPQAITLDINRLDIRCPNITSISEPFKKFVEDSQSKGTILFALGHYVDWNYAPKLATQAFMDAFAKLHEYRVVWQFVSESGLPKSIPSNVIMQSWVPQAAILNHAKTRLFISHMGFKSMRESLCSRVPILAMPMFAEQYRNTAYGQRRGYAEYLDKTQLSTRVIYEKITRILTNDRYTESVARIQNQLSDHIRDHMDLFNFLIDFHTRHNRSILKKYIRTKYRNLPYLAMGHIDLITLISISLFTICMMLF